MSWGKGTSFELVDENRCPVGVVVWGSDGLFLAWSLPRSEEHKGPHFLGYFRSGNSAREAVEKDLGVLTL